ncbi:MAG TPA: hypothetical protein PLN52_23280 [Opitutaceae bacterium]|nr:hypothetical protein [Opitutaceae bacterium]
MTPNSRSLLFAYASPRLSHCFRAFVAIAYTVLACAAFAQVPRITFNVPASDATVSLKRFAEQSGQEIVYPPESVKGVRTNEVRGEFTAREAIDALVAGTPLRVLESKSGAFAINRAPDPNVSGAASETRSDRPLIPVVNDKIAARPSKGEETVVNLSPLTVNTDKDDGFAAANAGTATRLALDMKDVPAPFSIMTQEFIDALGIRDVSEAVAWMPNVGAVPSEDVTTNPLLFNSRGVRNNRGQTRNNYLTGGLNDSYALERYEFGRGPNAALFNIGANSSLTGGLGAQTKRPRFDRNFETVTASIGSWDNLRTTLDVNRALTDKVAVRGNLLWADSRGFLDRSYSKSKGVTAAIAYLMTPKTEVRIEGAYDRMMRHQPSPDIFDALSGWDGVTVFREPISNRILGTQTAPGVANSLGYILSFQGEAQGVNRRAGKYYVWNAFNGQSAIMNYQNEAFTRKGDDTANTPVYANGVLYTRGTGLPFGLGYQGNAFPVPTQSPDGQHNFRYQENEPADLYDRAIRGSAFRPIGNESSFSMAPDTFLYGENLRDFNASISHQIGDRWFFELGGNINNVYGYSNREGVGGLRTIRIDINQLLPNGAENPNFLQPYGDGFISHSERSYLNRSIRGNVAYRHNLGKWGDYTFNLNVASSARTTVVRWHRFSVAQESDQRMWQATPIYIRQYWNQDSRPFSDAGVPTALFERTFAADNNSWTTSNVTIAPRWTLSDWSDTEEEFDNAVLAMSARYFGGRLVLLAVSRYDRYKSELLSRPAFGDIATDWNPLSIVYKPEAPADWATLSYIPRNAAGMPTQTQPIPAATRPRQNPPGVTTNNGVQIRNPLYADDRFRDDYRPPANTGSSMTGSYGLAYHVNKYVSAIANYATSYIPPATNAFDMRNELVQPLEGKGYDGGLRFHFFRERLTLNASYFYNREDFQRVASPVTTSINSLLGRNTATDPSTNGRNSLGLPDIFGTDYQSLETDGYELEIVGRISRGWRLMFNLGTAKVYTFNRYPQTKGFVDENAAFYRQVLEEAGGLLDTTRASGDIPGVAVVNPAVTAAIPSEQANAVLDYNNIWANYALVTGDLPVAGNERMTVNVFSDYTIQSGRLKGLRLGLGARAPGRDYMMSRSGDTIVDPSNPTRAIDDPTVDQTTPLYYRLPVTVTATFGYTLRLKGGSRFAAKELSFNLVIKNLLDERRPVMTGTSGSLRPPDGDFSLPNRVATPARVYGLTEPRSFLFTTTLKL